MPWQVSISGGCNSRWSADGSRLYFVGVDGWLYEVDVEAGEEFSTGQPRRLFYARTDREVANAGFALLPDGTFLLNRRIDDAGEPVTVVLGWEGMLDGFD